MHDEAREKDKNLENYFNAKEHAAIPAHITNRYTQDVLQKLTTKPSLWRMAILPVLGFALGAICVVALWKPWREPIVVTPAPSLPAIEVDARVLDQVSPADLPPLPTEDLLPQVEMLDTLMVAMEIGENRRALSIEEEMKVLTAIGADVGTSPESTEQELELLDEMETA